MRDPWSLIHEVRPGDDWFVPTERFVLQRLEHLALAHAARIIVNTPQFASALGDAKPDLKVMCLPNGVDLEYPTPRDVSSVERGSIAYVGTLYYGRNLSSVCAAMRLLLNDRPEAAATLRLNVAGPMDSPHRRRFEDEIAAGELTSVVNIHGVLPRAQALELLSRASLALVLAQDQPMQIPAKLYESVALGIPTLVIAEEMSAAACEARRIGAMTLDGGDVEGLRALFEDLLAGRLPTKIEAKAPIDYAHLAQQWDGILRDSLKAESDGVEHPRFVPTEGV
jgi:glycosyltransferase involved in cell wall biosynthesis